MNAKDEINKAIGVLKARMDYAIKYETYGNTPDSLEEWGLLFKAICSLEIWRDSDITHSIPEVARQMIWQ